MNVLVNLCSVSDGFEEGERHDPMTVLGGSFWGHYEKLINEMKDLKQREQVVRGTFHQCR